MSEIRKILIVRFSSLGDIILTFPLLKKLRRELPGAEIHFLTGDKYAETLKLNPVIDKVILHGISLSETRKRIRDENYDVILDLHKNPKSIYTCFMNSKRVFRVKKENLKKLMIVKFKINLFREVIPVYKKYINCAESVLSKSDLDFERDELIFSKGSIFEGDYIVISPSSRHFTKTYPSEKFIEFINRYPDRKFVLSGDNSERDKEICGYISGQCANTVNMCGKLNISALANVLYYSAQIICNDSAVLHLSEALGKNVMAVFGCTVKEFGFFPQLKQSEAIENKGLKCRPCTHIGRPSCPEKHFRCMDTEINLLHSKTINNL